ncbi:uncharacterized protein BDV17DRAFT_178738 [Aspergillus undulatus]|uniref:uncharacterized protein n=1 Tax=Aspergillus undulatus TaxID=1810928 RepID=UPI003CCD235F
MVGMAWSLTSLALSRHLHLPVLLSAQKRKEQPCPRSVTPSYIKTTTQTKTTHERGATARRTMVALSHLILESNRAFLELPKLVPILNGRCDGLPIGAFRFFLVLSTGEGFLQCAQCYLKGYLGLVATT